MGRAGRDAAGIRLARNPILQQLLRNRYLYLLLLPGIAFFIVFCYFPMYGVTLAFKDFNITQGIIGSPWVGFEHFVEMVEEPQFWRAFWNTLEISIGRIVTGFPIPILLALMFNEMRNGILRKGLQTIATFPNFLSWIVVSGIAFNLMGSQGAVNGILSMFGLESRQFLADPAIFRPMLYLSAIWKSAGWGSIIYLAAISGINPEIYEAATIDGATRIQSIRYITWPSISSTAVLMLILSIGGVMNAGFEQVFLMYNPTVYSVGDIIDTYVYRKSFTGAPQYELSTAVGLFKSAINFVLLFGADRVAKWIDPESGVL